MEQSERILYCPLCCSGQFSSRYDLQMHLVQVSILLNKLRCNLCNDRFITLQDLIEHLKHDCLDEEGQKAIQESSHITFVDCGAFCGTEEDEDENNFEVDSKMSECVQIDDRNEPAQHVMVPSNVRSPRRALSSSSIAYTMNNAKSSHSVEMSVEKPIQTKHIEMQASEEKVDIISLPPHVVEVAAPNSQQGDDYDEHDMPNLLFSGYSDSEEVVTSTPAKSKRVNKNKQKSVKKVLLTQLNTKSLVFYPKPKDGSSNEEAVHASETDTTEMGNFPEEEEMLTGTEEEALAAGADPNDIIYRCYHCETLFPEKSDYEKHSCLIKCNVCGQVFKNTRNLMMHMKTHNREQLEKDLKNIKITSTSKFSCESCNDEFSIDLKEIHDKIHNEGIKLYKCDKCQYIYVSMKELVKHDHLVHKVSQYKHTCSICNKKCFSAANLRNHMCTHTGLKPFKCQYCNKTFNRSSDKNKHERVHTGEKPNVCNICGKCFRVKCSLQLHMRTHTNERPYVCTLCGKAFKSFSSLSFHIKSHGQERPYKCPYCEKGFKTLNALHGHRNSHNKPFKCEICDRSFAVRNTMLKHQSNMHSNDKKVKFDCVVCGASYGRAWSLEIHLKTHGKLGNANANTDLLKKMVAMGSQNNKSDSTENIEPVKRSSRSRKKKQTLDL